MRVKLLRLVAATRSASEAFLDQVEAATAEGEGRRAIAVEAPLLSAGVRLRGLLGDLQDEMAIEQGLHEESAYGERLGVLHTWLDAAQVVLTGLGRADMVPWVEEGDLWVAPRELGPLWQKHMPPRTPLVFSSATLSAVGGSFAYSSAALGLSEPLTARVGVPFRMARQVLCYLPGDLPRGDDERFWPEAAARIGGLLAATSGRALILVPGPSEQRTLRALLQVGRHRVLWEGDAAPERLMAEFAGDVPSCLVAHSLWEGIDVPGEALSAVVIPALPLPGADPIVQARREASQARGGDPRAEVDVPLMALRLKQGVGRLIRSETDRGVVAVLDGRAQDFPDVLETVLPERARRVRTLTPVKRFLERGTADDGR